MGQTILLIEDNEQNRYLAAYLLEARGHTVIAAVDGKRGIELATGLQPDLILLDIQLPAMDGFAVARELRRRDGTRDVPIIAVTSYAMVGDRDKALAAGCDGYLEKPIDPATFTAEVERFLPPAEDGGLA